ncbi:UNVERIFIED_ORG: plasmid stabilization system protein ParE [Pseudomonas reinekei]|nr:plasmid stabilization system protein ParE [Pseudomonas reinekei]
MPRGDKDKYTDKQKRKAEHIEKSYEAKGVSKDESEARAWATVNKQSGGGERKGGSGHKTSETAKKKARKSSGKRAAATRKGGAAVESATGRHDQVRTHGAGTQASHRGALDHAQR